VSRKLPRVDFARFGFSRCRSSRVADGVPHQNEVVRLTPHARADHSANAVGAVIPLRPRAFHNVLYAQSLNQTHTLSPCSESL
jgi:hypothetical protein